MNGSLNTIINYKNNNPNIRKDNIKWIGSINKEHIMMYIYGIRRLITNRRYDNLILTINNKLIKLM